MAELAKILLIDDEPDFTRPMASWLASEGYAVEVAHEGEAAVAQVRGDAPDIVFLDLKMPGMDGVEVLRRIRDFNREIPVIIITAYVDDPQIKNISNLGISGVFYKGDDFIEGLSLIQSVLRLRKK